MKKIYLVLFLLFMGLALQAQENCPHYDRLIGEAEQFMQDEQYQKALDKYNTALTHCPEKQADIKAKIDALFEKVNRLREEAQANLQKAKEMQAKMETAVFDKAVKTKFPEWKGYNNEYESDREELLAQIDSLDLSQNALPAIPKELAECPNLVYLNLFKNNEIDWTSITRLKDLPKLESIDVSVNDLSDIEEQYWHKITGIEILKNGLVSFPENILAQTQLRYLDLRGNQLISLPKEIGNLTELKTLDLVGNEFTSLPKEIGNLTELKTLDLRFNQLTSLPKEIGNLTQLNTLYLSYNQFTSLPKEISNLTELKTLLLYNNKFTSLPKEIGNLTELEGLYLSDNPIRAEEQEKIKKLLPDCEIEFSEFSYALLLWAYHQQGILKDKVSEFREVKELDLTDYQITIETQKEIQALLPDCEIKFYQWTANRYNRLVIEEYNKGNYKQAYKLQKEACELDSTNTNSFFNLAYFALYNNAYEVAISAARKTLKLDPSRVSVETNLALGYLLNNQWAEAQKIYEKWKGKQFPDTGDDCNPIFLQDIADLEKAGVKHKDFERVRDLLKE